MTDLFPETKTITRRMLTHRLDEIISQMKTYSESDSRKALRLLTQLRKEIAP